MRYWQPIHHERWNAFLAGLDAALGRKDPAESAHVLGLEPVSETRSPILNESLSATELIPAILSEPLLEMIPETLAEIPHVPVPEPEVLRVPAIDFQPQLEPAAQAPALAPPAPSMVSGSARSFFSALGWSGAVAHFSTPANVDQTGNRPPESSVRKPAEPVQHVATSSSFENKAATFFSQIPWSGSSHFGEIITSIHVTATRNDLSLDPRTASLPNDNPLLAGMLSAARTSDRLAARPSLPSHARDFFTSIPWARN